MTSSYNASTVEFNLKPDASRWEGGTFAMAPLQAFAQSLQIFLEIGPGCRLETNPRPGRGRPRDRPVGGMDRLRIVAVLEDQAGIVALEKAGDRPRSLFAMGLRGSRGLFCPAGVGKSA